ncbi:hypothetical protein PUN4_370109 [Paraburkholderia unamae]|nr:hypothetical protein PUN4_370109 [Paraburkholderia unamae]
MCTVACATWWCGMHTALAGRGGGVSLGDAVVMISSLGHACAMDICAARTSLVCSIKTSHLTGDLIK